LTSATAYAIDAPRTQVWEEVEAAARTEIGAKKLKRLGEPKRTARKTWRAPNLQEEVEDMALVFRDLEEDFDKMRRRQHELGVSHGPVCQVSETVEVSRVPAVLRDAALEDLFHEVCLRHQARGGGKGPALRKKSGVTVGLPREFTMADANKILGLHNTKVKVKPVTADDLVDPHCLASKKSLMLLYTAFLPEKTLMETITELWTEAYDTQNEPVAALYLSHIVKRDAKGRRGALVPNPKALKRRPALKRVSLLPEPVPEVVLGARIKFQGAFHAIDARSPTHCLIYAQVVLPSDYTAVVARHLKRTSRDSRDERRLSRSSFYRDQALRDLGATRPPSQEEEEVPERAETPYDIREAIARRASRLGISQKSPLLKNAGRGPPGSIPGVN